MGPSGLLTMLGLVVAAFAIIPKERLLDLRLRITMLDWVFITSSFILVHYIIYFPVLNEFGLVLNLGPWRWGFSEENTIYLIFLCLTVYLFISFITAKVTRKNIKGFCELFEGQILERKYGELSFLLQRHLNDIIKIKNHVGFRNSVAMKLRPSHRFLVNSKSIGENKDGLLKRKFPSHMRSLANFIEKPSDHQELALSLIRRILTSPEYVSYLAISKPYFCVDILKNLSRGFGIKEEFLKLFIYSLIDNLGSVYYFELEHTNTMSSKGFSRFIIPKSNKLLFYLFSDVKVSENLAVYKPVGDKIFDILNYDLKVISRYNEPLGTYFENYALRCPINSSLHFFEIMILESMHQGIKWHMWLYYFSSFTKKIVGKLNPDSNVDLNTEWPTPFHCLLYRIVSIILGWLEEYQYVENKENLTMENESLNHDNGSIPKSAALALGEIVYSILSSNKITDRFKIYILEMVMRFLKNNQNTEECQPLTGVLMKSILFKGVYNESDSTYLRKFDLLYGEIDDFDRFGLKDFNELLAESLANAGPAG